MVRQDQVTAASEEHKPNRTPDEIADMLAEAGDAMVTIYVQSRWSEDLEQHRESFAHLVKIREAESFVRGCTQDSK